MGGGGGRFRLLVLVGALAMVVSGFLPWWRTGGEEISGVVLPAAQGIGLEGPGIVIYAAAVLALVVLDIGYMRSRRGFVLDTSVTYIALGVVAALALVYRAWQLWSVGYVPLPQTSPGLAVAAAGIGMLLYGGASGYGAVQRY